MFKRFTLLVVEYIREKFVWAKKKPVIPDFEHDKRIAENYVFDEVQGIYVPRAEYERRAKFNNNDYKPTKNEISRFPSRFKQERSEADKNQVLTSSISTTNRGGNPQLKPPGYYNSVHKP